MEEFKYMDLLDVVPIENGASLDVVVDLLNVTKQAMKLGIRFDANALIDALHAKVGRNGNVLIRTFTWDFCHGKGYNIKKTVGQSGSLGNLAMKRPDYKRTKHPIYNWTIWGKDRDELCSIDNKEAFDLESIFAWEEKNPKAYQLVIGRPKTNGMTVFHYMEYKVQVPYRFVKDFVGPYTDYDGLTTKKTYSMYVRDLKYDIETSDEFYIPMLEQQGIKVNGYYNGILVELYKLDQVCSLYEEDFRKNGIPSGVTITPVAEGGIS